jgi:UDP-GlcNAc3NAcA epimerase
MLERLEVILRDARPDRVLVYGDTNSTLAGALAAAKLDLLLIHVEAGLRSFNRRMPEEINRVVADHISSLLLAPTPKAMELLESEGLASRSRYTGDLMYDAVLYNRELASRRPPVFETLDLKRASYGVVTLHRAENTDDPKRLRGLLDALNQVAQRQLPLVLPLHPRTRRQISETARDWTPDPRLRVIEPLGYLDMLGLLQSAAIALTDSGGLQKEAFFLGCPCVTLRDETEWVETVEAGANLLAGAEPARIQNSVERWLDPVASGAARRSDPRRWYGDGHAAQHALEAVLSG